MDRCKGFECISTCLGFDFLWLHQARMMKQDELQHRLTCTFLISSLTHHTLLCFTRRESKMKRTDLVQIVATNMLSPLLISCFVVVLFKFVSEQFALPK
jgi:hypothetical protein